MSSTTWFLTKNILFGDLKIYLKILKLKTEFISATVLVLLRFHALNKQIRNQESFLLPFEETLLFSLMFTVKQCVRIWLWMYIYVHMYACVYVYKYFIWYINFFSLSEMKSLMFMHLQLLTIEMLRFVLNK